MQLSKKQNEYIVNATHRWNIKSGAVRSGKAKKASIIDRIRCTIRLMGAGRFWITEDCKSLQTALSDAVWNKDVKDKDERLDDGSTDIDSLDAFEYTIERDMRDLIEEVEDV